MFRKKEATPVLGYLIFEALIMITTSVLVILHLVEQDAVTGICQRMDNQNQGATIRVKNDDFDLHGLLPLAVGLRRGPIPMAIPI